MPNFLAATILLLFIAVSFLCSSSSSVNAQTTYYSASSSLGRVLQYSLGDSGCNKTATPVSVFFGETNGQCIIATGTGGSSSISGLSSVSMTAMCNADGTRMTWVAYYNNPTCNTTLPLVATEGTVLGMYLDAALNHTVANYLEGVTDAAVGVCVKVTYGIPLLNQVGETYVEVYCRDPFVSRAHHAWGTFRVHVTMIAAAATTTIFMLAMAS
jgi:hypothetical protein